LEQYPKCFTALSIWELKKKFAFHSLKGSSLPAFLFERDKNLNLKCTKHCWKMAL